jgi:hypothetical protein
MFIWFIETSDASSSIKEIRRWFNYNLVMNFTEFRIEIGAERIYWAGMCGAR